jgi:hypothetical protein
MIGKKIISETIKDGKQKNDLHPHFRNLERLKDIIAKIQLKKTIRRITKLINCK